MCEAHPSRVHATAPLHRRPRLSLLPSLNLSEDCSASASVVALNDTSLEQCISQHTTGLQLASRVYSVTDCKLAFPVRLQIPHTATDEQLDRLAVMRLASDDEASGTHWEVLHGATFTTAYAELEVEHFSLYAVMCVVSLGFIITFVPETNKPSPR